MAGDPTTSLPEDDEPDFLEELRKMGEGFPRSAEEDSPPQGASPNEIDWRSLRQKYSKYSTPTCQKCGTPLECMPGGGCLADFECPKCCPEGFRPLGMTLEEWHKLNRVLDTLEIEERIELEDGMIGR